MNFIGVAKVVILNYYKFRKELVDEYNFCEDNIDDIIRRHLEKEARKFDRIMKG